MPVKRSKREIVKLLLNQEFTAEDDEELIDLLDETINFLKNNPTFYNYFTLGLGSISDIWHETFENYMKTTPELKP